MTYVFHGTLYIRVKRPKGFKKHALYNHRPRKKQYLSAGIDKTRVLRFVEMEIVYIKGATKYPKSPKSMVHFK